MISYKEALDRHGLSEVKKHRDSTSTFEKYLVGSTEFWETIDYGILCGHENVNGSYVGIVTDFYSDDESVGTIWVFVKPDPTSHPLPEGQLALPVAHQIREEIWLETL